MRQLVRISVGGFGLERPRPAASGEDRVTHFGTRFQLRQTRLRARCHLQKSGKSKGRIYKDESKFLFL